MYLFRQFWAFLWIADFFQKSIVSRGSVNGDLEKGPPFAQSFSTEVAIESGLYIAPGIQVWQVLTTFSGPDTSLAPNLQNRNFSQKVEILQNLQKSAESQLFAILQVSAHLAPNPRNPAKPANLLSGASDHVPHRIPAKPAKSRLLAKSRVWTCLAGILSGHVLRGLAIPDAICAQGLRTCAHQIRGIVQNHVCTCVFATRLAHVHNIHRVKGKLVRCIHLATFVSFFNIVRFENNFWNK